MVRVSFHGHERCVSCFIPTEIDFELEGIHIFWPLYIISTRREKCYRILDEFLEVGKIDIVSLSKVEDGEKEKQDEKKAEEFSEEK